MENNEKNKKIEDFSPEKGNVEIVSQTDSEVAISPNSTDDSVCINQDGINVKKSGNLVIGSLNIIANPLKETLKDRHKKHYKESKFHLLADIFLVLCIVGFLAFFLIIRNLDTGVDLGLKASLSDKRASSGNVEIFEISYDNPSRFPITQASISVRLPENFIFLKAYPSDIFNETANTFRLGDLPAGAGGKVKLEGLILGDVGSQQVLNLSFNYFSGKKMNNVLESLVYPIEDSVLSLGFEAPKEVYKDTLFRGRLIAKNNGVVDLPYDLEIVLRKPSIEIEDIDSEKASLNNNAIVISGLTVGEKVIVDFKALPPSTEGASEILWEAYLKTDNGSIKQGEIKDVFRIVVPKLSLSIISDKNVVSDGEQVDFVLNYENGESIDLDNPKLFFNAASSAFRIEKFSIPDDPRYHFSGSDIFFDAPIKVGEKGTLKFTVVFERKNSVANQEAGLLVSLSYGLAGEQISREIYSNSLKFLSDLSVSSKAVYYSTQGDQLGIGPLPPIVDVPTRYWIFWEVDNIGNRLENLSVSAVLPDNVYWTDQKSLVAGKVRYGETTKKVVWNVDEIASKDGEYRAGFEIELIPVVADTGRVVDILKDIKFSAFDAFAGKEISGDLPTLNTDLKDDGIASGQGKVLKMNIIR